MFQQYSRSSTNIINKLLIILFYILIIFLRHVYIKYDLLKTNICRSE